MDNSAEIERLEKAINCPWCKFWKTLFKGSHENILYQAARERLAQMKDGK